jgi:cytosine/adenosine deaminase-related metal-dependent hydrolase
VASVLIKGGHLLDLERPFAPGDLLIEDGRIVAVGGAIDAAAERVIDASGKVVMPGLVNAHTHSNQALERGLSDNLPLDAWMVLASYGGAGAQLDAHDLYVSAQVGAIEMLLSGTTAVLDMPRMGLATFHEDAAAVMQAYADVGLRAVVAASYADRDFYQSVPIHLVTDRPPGGGRPRATVEQLERLAREFVQHWQGRHPLLTPGVGPSSLPRCSDALFERSVAIAHDLGAPLQSHLLSAKSQVLLEQERYGGSTVQYLERIGALGPAFSYAHCIWVSEPDCERLARGGSVAVTNPSSNLKLGSGVAPVQAFRRAGATLALGTDGASSNDSQNMWDTLKCAAIVHKVYGQPRDWVGARDALRAAWQGGASALRQPVGALQVGRRGDVALLRTDRLFVLPQEFMFNQLVYGESGASVDTVLVDGQVVVERGEVVTVDARAVYDQARAIVARIYADMDERRRRFAETAGLLERMETLVRETALPFARTFDLCG